MPANTQNLYASGLWRRTRELALERDENRCTVSRLLGGACSGRLDAHHIVAVAEGGAPFDLENVGTACSSHHPMWEALRRHLVRRLLAGPPRCNHQHRSEEGRRICERRLARRAATRDVAA